MRGVSVLIMYLLGLGAIISFGIAGLMALQSPIKQTPSAPAAAVSPCTKSGLQSRLSKQRERMRSPIRSARR